MRDFFKETFFAFINRSKLLTGLVFLRSGALFNTGFLRRMLFEAVQYGLDETQPLLKTLVCEAECTTLKNFSTHSPYDENKQGKKTSSCFAKSLTWW